MFRKRRDALRTDPRVKEAISEAKKFKGGMKKEVGMERMFGERKHRAAAEENGSNKDASSTTASEKNNEGEAAKSSSPSSFLSSPPLFIVATSTSPSTLSERKCVCSTWTKANSSKKNGENNAKSKCEIDAAGASRDGDAPASTAVQIVKSKTHLIQPRMFEDETKAGF